MPIDKYTRDILKSMVDAIRGVSGRLDQLVGIANRPRKDDVEAASPRSAPTDEEYAAMGKMLFALHIAPSPADRNDPVKSWYQTFEGWKKAAEMVGIGFAIGYAMVTFCEWRDLKHNFFVEEKSLIKYQVSWPSTPTASSPVGVNITNIGKFPIISAIMAGHIEIFPAANPTRLADGPHPASTDLHPFIFPNDSYLFTAQFFDEASGKPRSFTDQEVSDLMEGRAYIAILGLIRYRDELGMHWLRFCDWHGYAANSIYNARDCVEMNDGGDGLVPNHPTNQHYWQNH